MINTLLCVDETKSFDELLQNVLTRLVPKLRMLGMVFATTHCGCSGCAETEHPQHPQRVSANPLEPSLGSEGFLQVPKQNPEIMECGGLVFQL